MMDSNMLASVACLNDATCEHGPLEPGNSKSNGLPGVPFRVRRFAGLGLDWTRRRDGRRDIHHLGVDPFRSSENGYT